MPDTLLLQAIVSRPELADVEPKLFWFKAQMEHARGAVQAQQASGTAKELQASRPLGGSAGHAVAQPSPCCWRRAARSPATAPGRRASPSART